MLQRVKPAITTYLHPRRPRTGPRPRAEIELLLHCARTTLEPERMGLVRTVAARVRDWAYVCDLAQAHGVMPLLYTHLKATCPDIVPPALLERLRETFNANARKNMILTAELLRLLQCFRTQNLTVLAFKGPILAHLAYGNLALRQFIDLDLLIPEAEYSRASHLLNEQGFHPLYTFSPTQEAWHVQAHYELDFHHADKLISVDLHWALLPKKFSFSPEPDFLWKHPSLVCVGGTAIQTLSTEILLLFLCAHSAKHGWCSLGYVCDVAEMLRTHPDINWEWILAHSQTIGTQRMLYLGLLLAHDMLAAPLPPSIFQKIEADPAVASLAAHAKKSMFQDNIGIIGQFVTSNVYLRSMEKRRDKVRYWVGEVLTPTPLEWAVIALPPPFFWLYYPLRPLRVGLKLVAEAVKKVRSGWRRATTSDTDDKRTG